MLPGSRNKVVIDAGEVYRYLGYGGSDPTEEVVRKVERCVVDLYEASELRQICRRFDLEFPNEENTLSIGGIHIRSGDLMTAFAGCVEVYVFGATIGVGVDRLIAKATINDVAAAAIYQAAGTAYIESYCDAIQEDVKRIAAENDRTIVPRFSPGYGDLSIEDQKNVFDLLDLTKNTGIGLTEGMLMMPSKSVTAMIGVACDGAKAGSEYAGREKNGNKRGEGAGGHRCCSCDMITCPFRKG